MRKIIFVAIMIFPVSLAPALVIALTLDIDYSTYLGGIDAESATGISIGTNGMVYVIGSTSSSDFPTLNPYQAVLEGDYDILVSALSSTGSLLSYSTYLGGSSTDYGRGIGLRTDGMVYLTGATRSLDFPTKNPYQAGYGGGTWGDGFVTAISSNGSTIYYSTYLGGSGIDEGMDISIGTGGMAYITGSTTSLDFPTKNPYQAIHAVGSSDDGFVTAISSNGSTIYYSTYLGGSGHEYGRGISVGPTGDAYITGYTQSSNFPTKNSYQASYSGNSDIFVSAFSSSGSALSYSTYLGGSGMDDGCAINVGMDGITYITGNTTSPDFPTKNPYQAGYAGDYDVFITALISSSSNIIYSTYLGGNSYDYGWGIDLGSDSSAYITGYTQSLDFPTKNPYQALLGGNIAAFVSILSADGSKLSNSTYLGGTNADFAYGISVGPDGSAYVTGFTYSSDFPTKNPYQAVLGGGDYDIFVSKLTLVATPTPIPSPSPTPMPCISPLRVKNIEYITIQTTRASSGLGWYIRALHWNKSINFGYVSDNLNVWNNGGSVASYTQLRLKIDKNSEDIDIHNGDKIQIGYDTYYFVNVILPKVTVDGTELYIGMNGNTYTDFSLCHIAKGTPSPIPTKSAISTPTASPTPSAMPTPSMTPVGIGAPPRIYDYNGDGTSDIAIFRGGSGLWAIRGITRVYFGSSADETVPGDYNGDGTTEIGIFRGTSGLWAIRGTTRAYFGSGSDFPEPGDYDGDGTADIGIFRYNSGLWAIRGVTRAYFGGAADSPASGYYDGDSTKDIGIFRGSSGLWAIRGISRVYFGGSSDMIVPGDYNGDGVWDYGIFRGTSGLWAIRGVTRSYFGSSVDQPVPGDYKGEGRDNIGIFRGTSGLWAISGVSRVYFGGSGDVPVTR